MVINAEISRAQLPGYCRTDIDDNFDFTVILNYYSLLPQIQISAYELLLEGLLSKVMQLAWYGKWSDYKEIIRLHGVR